MTTSDLLTNPPKELFVWIWLPGATEPVVCGRLDEGKPITFTYARSYRERPDAVPVYPAELPLDGTPPFQPLDGDRMPLCIDDAMPDSWGRRLVNHRLGAGYADLPELTYLLASSSDRIGALDFQESPAEYIPRDTDTPTLGELADASRKLEDGEPLHERLTQALLHGTSIGGARPKALLHSGTADMIAKFSSSTDHYPVVQGEYVAMTLARRCGLDVATVELVAVHGRSVLLVERFDRPGGGLRRRVVSALTVLGMNTFPSGRYATYALLADAIRETFDQPDRTLRELFSRISFNILCGNIDDHGRNHAAFVNDAGLALTPAYDICPQARTGGTASQAMAYGRDGQRDARIAPLVDSAGVYHLDRREAQAIIDRQIELIHANWGEVCDMAQMTVTQRDAFMGGQFLNAYAFDT
jgi:serine/threonine-protein kinase HipA